VDSTLLASKVHIPPTTHRLVHRHGLVDALETGVRVHALILVSAPGGYGKTTLLSGWARETRFRVFWLSVGEEENDPQRFYRCLLAAWQAAEPGLTASPLGLILGSQEPDIEAACVALINLASDLTERTVFVLDDFHLITEESVLKSVTFLIDNLPPMLRFVLSGRGEPDLPLARYRARDMLLELNAGDLQFTNDEASLFLHHMTGLSLGVDRISDLQSQLEGWAAGLQLVGLGLRQGLTEIDQISVSGKHRFVADYLLGEVIAGLPSDDQRFLLEVSILDRLSGPLCDALTGNGDGQQKLERLEREGLFLEPLDDHREWFRFHPLFSRVLLEELIQRYPEDVAALHLRAARWSLEHDLADPAFRHAVASGDAELTEQIVDRYVMVKLYGGDIRSVQGWMEALPKEWFSSRPMLGLARVGLLMFTGQFAECLQCLDDVEQMARSSTPAQNHTLARVAAVRCFIACFHHDLPAAERLAEEALRNLPAEDLTFRAGIHGALGDTYRESGQWVEARANYLKTFDYMHSPLAHFHSAHVYGALADLDLRQGHLRAAADNWRRGIAAVEDPSNSGALPLQESGWLYLRLSELLYEWNELDEAFRLLGHGLDRAELAGDVRSRITGYVTSAYLERATGDLDAAAAQIERARPLIEEAPFPDLSGRFERCRLDVWLAQGKLKAVADWTDAALRESGLQVGTDHEPDQLALARALIVKGDAPSRQTALSLLQQLNRTAEAEGRKGIQVEAQALIGLAQWAAGDRTEALTSAEHALRLAEPEGFVRLFVDLGLPMGRVLQEARTRGVMPDYVATLLEAAGAGLTGSSELPEPLTNRELEVLALIAAGLTNREIADKLSISPQTVKKHGDNIYGKLNVRGRTEAAVKARELDLLH